MHVLSRVFGEKKIDQDGSGYFDTQLEGYLNIPDSAPYRRHTTIGERVAKKAAWKAQA